MNCYKNKLSLKRHHVPQTFASDSGLTRTSKHATRLRGVVQSLCTLPGDVVSRSPIKIHLKLFWTENCARGSRSHRPRYHANTRRPRHASPHASPRQLAADSLSSKMEPYYYGHKSAPIGRRSGHCAVFVYNTSFALTFDFDLRPWLTIPSELWSIGHDPYTSK